MAASAPSNLDLAVAWATIGTFAVVVLGAAFYAFGALWPLKLDVTAERGLEKGRESTVTDLTVVVTNRSRNTKTISDLALVRKPGWWKRRFTRKAEFDEDDVDGLELVLPEGSDLRVGGHDALIIHGIHSSDVLPFGTEPYAYVTVGPRPFFGRIRDATSPASALLVDEFKRQQAAQQALAAKDRDNPGPEPSSEAASATHRRQERPPPFPIGRGELDLFVSGSSDNTFGAACAAVRLHRVTNLDVVSLYAALLEQDEVRVLVGVDQATVDRAAALLRDTGTTVTSRSSSSR